MDEDRVVPARPGAGATGGGSPSPYGLRALLVDYGGVLTTPVGDSLTAWARADGVDVTAFGEVMAEWVGAGAARVDGAGPAPPRRDDPVPGNPAQALERGELGLDEFERALARRLRRVDGGELVASGLVARMLGGFRVDRGMEDVLLLARAAGFRTGLLSNSWGLDYPRDGWTELFDEVVISGEVGLRKPEPEIYRLAAERLGVPPGECAFVDDLASNVRGAAAVGMVGVHHTSLESTVQELEELLGVPLRWQPPRPAPGGRAGAPPRLERSGTEEEGRHG